MTTADTTVAVLRGATKRYGAVVALHGIDLQLRRGELLALLGPNGAGKSTAISLLLGLARADAGTVELFGQDPQRVEARRRIGVMLQEASLPPTLRVGELLRLISSYYPAPRSVAESAQLAGVDDLLQRPYARLSGGQQRRVQFALAICGQPELLFLDEPTVGMDIEARQKLWAAIRALTGQGCAVVLTTHYLEEAEALADRVCVLARGRVISEGSVEQLRTRVALKRVRCHTALDLAQVAAWPEVAEARREGERLWLATAHPEQVVRRLFEQDATLFDLEVQRAGLGEAFAELTREADTHPDQYEAA